MSYRIWLEDGPAPPTTPDAFRALLDEMERHIEALLTAAPPRQTDQAAHEARAFLTAARGGPRVEVNDDGANYGPTWNYGEMMARAGAVLSDWEGKPAAEALPLIEGALAAIRSDEAAFRAMESPNRWGTVENLIKLYEGIAARCRAFPNAVIRVWK